MLATEQQVADLQRQLTQEKARTSNLPPDTTAAHADTEPKTRAALDLSGAAGATHSKL